MRSHGAASSGGVRTPVDGRPLSAIAVVLKSLPLLRRFPVFAYFRRCHLSVSTHQPRRQLLSEHPLTFPDSSHRLISNGSLQPSSHQRSSRRFRSLARVTSLFSSCRLNKVFESRHRCRPKCTRGRLESCRRVGSASGNLLASHRGARIKSACKSSLPTERPAFTAHAAGCSRGNCTSFSS